MASLNLVESTPQAIECHGDAVISSPVECHGDAVANSPVECHGDNVLGSAVGFGLDAEGAALSPLAD